MASTVLKFSAQWCQPCKQLNKAISEEYKERIQEIDVDDHPELAKQYGIRSIPVLVKLINGKEIDRLTGIQNKTRINSFLSE